MTTLLPPPLPSMPPRTGQPAPPPGPPAPWWRRALLGPPGQARWVRPAVLALLASTALLYLWGLDRSGWGNSFYSAAVQAGTRSWKAFFFGSSDAASSITVDKPPLSLWVMELSARVFGLSSWSVLAPQALEGVAAVGLLHLTVRRWAGPAAGLLAGAVLALTPVAALMFRYNNPDALLALLLVGAAYATTRAVESGRTSWLVGAGALVGLGFMTKTLQALLVVPALGAAYLLAGPPRLGRRLLQLLAAAVALAVTALWWVVAVTAVPASSRPYIGGSQDNSEWNLIFGYNGFGRLTGNESGSVGGGPVRAGATGQWGPTGLLRLFNSSFGGQASWLLPTALVLLAAGLVVTWRRPRTDRARAALVLWGGTLLVTGLTLSLGKGIIHPYYTVALAPSIGACTAVGASLLWGRRHHPLARGGLAAAVVAAATWAFVLLGRTPHFAPWLRPVVLVAGVGAAAALLAWGHLRSRVAAVVVVVALAVGLAGPAAYALDTAATPHTGALASAGPAGQGGPGFGGPRFGFGGRGLRGGFPGRFPGGGFPGGAPPGGGFPGGGFPGATGGSPGGAATGGLPGGTGSSGGTGGQAVNPAGPGTGPGGGLPGRALGGRGGPGGLLGSSTPSAAVRALLEEDASRYRWVAATTGAEQASGYQLATGGSVMPIGGFNGTDPSPTLAQFEAWVGRGEIHWYIAGGGFGGPGGGGGSSTSRAIASWVESHFTARTVSGVTLYDLTAPVAGTTGA